ncbi:MAG TPA: hypothetical protein DCL15_18170 [Chloroflexi bacterium]|nr:hypothetical protein [Chloroflexota bacterium]HHW87318.1 hypothetical protein [Chloroflexota bacterium]
MTDKRTQALRLAAESTHTPARSAISGRAVSVIERYRLQPDDLPGGEWEGRIHSVNTQGVEALTPLAFIEGLAKPMALSDEDMHTLLRMTDSPFANDWIGCKVVVRAVRIDAQRVLRLYAPGMVGLPVDIPVAASRPRHRRPWLAVSLLLALIALSVWLVYAVEQRTLLWAFLQQAVTTPGAPPTP